MLDFFTILTKGGLILWYIQNTQRDHLTFVNRLLSDIFVEERVGLNKYVHQNIQMEYRINNRWNIIYVAGYYRSFSLSYVKDMLIDVDTAFENKLHSYGYAPENVDYFLAEKMDFSTDFDVILKYRLQNDTLNARTLQSSSSNKEQANKMLPNEGIQQNKPANIKSVTESPPSPNKTKKAKTKAARKPKAKAARVWDDEFCSKNIENSKLMESLDFSGETPTSGCNDDIGGLTQKDLDAVSKSELSKTLYESITSKNPSAAKQSKSSPKFFDYFKGLVGNRQISEENLETIMTSMKHHLCDKNVASDIADDICVSVTNKLVGKTLGTFEMLKNTVKSAMVESIQKVLTPSNDFDLLNAVELVNKNFQRPYVIVMCGVNGVGKSTNLAKISHHLVVNRDFKLMIAACDTFRSGAVEQLRTHVSRLNHITAALSSKSKSSAANGQSVEPIISLYDKGYNKDASMVAKEAIAQAKKLKKNVVLIDTAGRMQDNEPLMRSLAKLIHVNSPDLVLFVGEALVGNDGVDQLKKFNNSLKEYACNSNPHLIDGIVLTKFDTIDDKVGAAISMTYTSGKPIMFVGIGQTYSDIKKLDVDSVVKLLFQ